MSWIWFTFERVNKLGPQAGRLLLRVWNWCGNYLALNRPLDWRYTCPGAVFLATGERRGERSWWAWERADHAPFYLGIGLGCLAGHLLLGGSLDFADPQGAAHLGNNVVGLLLACSLYPAVHRLGRFEELRSGWGSLLLAGLYGFVFPVLELVLVG